MSGDEKDGSGSKNREKGGTEAQHWITTRCVKQHTNLAILRLKELAGSAFVTSGDLLHVISMLEHLEIYCGEIESRPALGPEPPASKRV